MADFVLETRVWLPRPRPEVFAFFADPRNLSVVNPPSVALAWLATPPEALFAGAVLDFTVRALVARTRWRVIVREFDAPYRFVDAQLHGPFARWEHRHRFLEGAAPAGGDTAGTWIEDRVTYRLPLGPIGRLAHAAAVGRKIRAMFAYRERRLRELFPVPPA